MKRKTRLVLIFSSIILILTAFNNFTSISAHSKKSNSFSVDIVEADYADLDNDEMEDDTYIISHVLFSPNKHYRTTFYLYLEIIKPDGSRIGFVGSFSEYKEDFVLIIYALNSVDQSGWYLAYLEITTHQAISFDYIWYDPPAMDGGTPH